MAKTLVPPKSPNLLVGPIEYAQDYQNQLNKVLRLYFNTIDNTLEVLMENSGGRFLNFPHIFASDSESQYATADDTATAVKWSDVVRAEGFTLNTLTGAATANFSGAYNLSYRLQVENTDISAHTVWVWMKVDDVDVDGSATKFTIPANAGVDSYVVCESFIETELNGGSEIKLFWATDKAATSVGGLGVYLESYDAQSSPFVCPAIPSAYGSITFVSELSQ